jgi:hypothetical protein
MFVVCCPAKNTHNSLLWAPQAPGSSLLFAGGVYIKAGLMFISPHQNVYDFFFLWVNLNQSIHFLEVMEGELKERWYALSL